MSETWEDTPTKTTKARGKVMATETKEDSPQFYRVRQTHPTHNRRVVFRSVSESRAKDFVANRFPRGSEVYLENPDGSTHHYEAERAGDKGQDVDKWQPFNPEDWVVPAEAVVPGQDAWADKEG